MYEPGDTSSLTGVVFRPARSLVHRAMVHRRCHRACCHAMCAALTPRAILLEDKYNAFSHSSQFDIIIGAALTEAFLETMHWFGSGEFRSSKKAVWHIIPSELEVAGFVNSGGSIVYAELLSFCLCR